MQNAKMMSFVSTADPEKALAFYQDVLGLQLTDKNAMALVFDSEGVMLRISIVEKLEPQEFTVLGWQVEDIRAEMETLAAKGVEFVNYGFPGQDEQGVWNAGGTLIAWFKDPDGNLLSLAQFAG